MEGPFSSTFYVVLKFSSFVGNTVLSVPVHMHFVKYLVFGSLEDAKFYVSKKVFSCFTLIFYFSLVNLFSPPNLMVLVLTRYPWEPQGPADTGTRRREDLRLTSILTRTCPGPGENIEPEKLEPNSRFQSSSILGLAPIR